MRERELVAKVERKGGRVRGRKRERSWEKKREFKTKDVFFSKRKYCR